MKEQAEHTSTATNKGQVTGPNEPLPMTLADAYGSVKPLSEPEDFGELRRVAREERVARYLAKENA